MIPWRRHSSMSCLQKAESSWFSRETTAKWQTISGRAFGSFTSKCAALFTVRTIHRWTIFLDILSTHPYQYKPASALDSVGNMDKNKDHSHLFFSWQYSFGKIKQVTGLPVCMSPCMRVNNLASYRPGARHTDYKLNYNCAQIIASISVCSVHGARWRCPSFSGGIFCWYIRRWALVFADHFLKQCRYSQEETGWLIVTHYKQ